MKIILLAAMLAAPPAVAKEGIRTAAVDAPAPDFTLPDTFGKERKLSDSKRKVVVLEWLNVDCPFVHKHYDSKNMQTLQKEYTAKGVMWYSIVSSAPGKQGNFPPDKLNEINAQRDGHASAILLDPKGTVGGLYDAKTTPDMVVIDRGVLKYQGAIDDRPTSNIADVPGARNYVREALDAVLAGKPVKTGYTKSYGCSVKY
ncbi:MAG: thioredoxin family protein [Elusimicrobia bacterium]|nr:thioredoxin family protein [Elusimicrobiota bacterium]